MIDIQGTVDEGAVTIARNGDEPATVPVSGGAFAYPVTLVDGPNVITVTAADCAGNLSTLLRTVVYDKEKPALAVHPVASPTNQNSQTLSGDREALATITVGCPTATVGTVTNPTPTTWNVTLTGLSPGINTITVTGKDAAMNESILTVAITLDTGAPTTTIAINGGASRTNSASVTLNLTASTDAAAMHFKNESGDWTGAETYSATKSWILSAGDGAKTVSVKVQDTAGNWSPPSAATIILDTAAPAMTVAINGGAPRSKSRSVTLNIAASPDAAMMQFKNETGVWTASEAFNASKSWTLTAGDGAKTVSARVGDTAGNWSPPSDATIALDTVAPVTTASPAAGFIGKREAISLISSEAVTIYYTVDGSTPLTSSTVYGGPILLAADATVKFFARDLAGNQEAVRSAAYRIALPGDVNLSNKVDIADAILAMQLLSRMTPAGTVSRKADADGDGKIGLAEVLYVLQKAAGLR